MTISIPLIALVVLIVYIAYRYLGLRVWHAIVCALLGFLLAATSAAPPASTLAFFSPRLCAFGCSGERCVPASILFVHYPP